jgi:hypothetical protein
VSGEMEKIRNTSDGVAVDLKTIQQFAIFMEFPTELLIVLVQFSSYKIEK